jgi:transcriptional regulator with XRE-family HTH domain
MKMTTGAQIRKYRSMLGWTLKQLSDRSGVDVGTISALELRSSNRSKYLGPIASALGLSIEQLQDQNQVYMPNPRPIAAMEEAATYKVTPLASWPFTQITPKDWETLSPHQKSQAEIFIRGMIAAAALQETPQKMAAK